MNDIFGMPFLRMSKSCQLYMHLCWINIAHSYHWSGSCQSHSNDIYIYYIYSAQDVYTDKWPFALLCAEVNVWKNLVERFFVTTWFIVKNTLIEQWMRYDNGIRLQNSTRKSEWKVQFHWRSAHSHAMKQGKEHVRCAKTNSKKRISFAMIILWKRCPS